MSSMRAFLQSALLLLWEMSTKRCCKSPGAANYNAFLLTLEEQQLMENQITAIIQAACAAAGACTFTMYKRR
jgi:hypothetical protein